MRCARARGGVVLSALLLATLFIGATVAENAPPGARRPLTRQALTSLLRLGWLADADLSREIADRHVDFKITPESERDLRSAGASDALIEAVKSAFPTESGKVGGSAAGEAAPLSSDEVVALLKGGQTSEAVETLISARGAGFVVTPETANAIRAAGGSRSLLGTASMTRKGGSAFDDLLDRAVSAANENSVSYAIDLLEQAAKIHPENPSVHSLLGHARFHFKPDPALAVENIKAAMRLGGWVSFRMKHFHRFSDKCTGVLFVSQSEVAYKADRGDHSFVAQRSQTDVRALSAKSWFSLKNSEAPPIIGSWIHVKAKPLKGGDREMDFVFLGFSAGPPWYEIIADTITPRGEK